MLERRILGDIPNKPHTVFEYKAGRRGFEYVFTRDGFAGGFSILYTKEAPTSLIESSVIQDDHMRFLGSPLDHKNIGNTRRHVRSWNAHQGNDLVGARSAMFMNASCRVSVVRGSLGDSDYGFVNGDYDELYFVYEGSGVVHTMFGKLPYKKHDYVLIPRQIPYRFVSDHMSEMLVMEGNPGIEIPADFRNPYGQLKLEAPYTHRDFRVPHELLTDDEADVFKRLITLKNNVFNEHIYQKSPVNVVGWDGSVYPMAFSIHDYLPKTGKVHLPPNLHLTFQSARFVVCSFVPRKVDYGEGAIPCPYPHGNVHCDELLYYVTGNFTSRKGISERSISFHPAGLPHGPQPGNYFASIGAEDTNELAVMIDTWDPLMMTEAALEVDDPSYVVSWKE
jgi:homogentisate 1,2-dioxygenase